MFFNFRPYISKFQKCSAFCVASKEKPLVHFSECFRIERSGKCPTPSFRALVLFFIFVSLLSMLNNFPHFFLLIFCLKWFAFVTIKKLCLNKCLEKFSLLYKNDFCLNPFHTPLRKTYLRNIQKKEYILVLHCANGKFEIVKHWQLFFPVYILILPPKLFFLVVFKWIRCCFWIKIQLPFGFFNGFFFFSETDLFRVMLWRNPSHHFILRWMHQAASPAFSCDLRPNSLQLPFHIRIPCNYSARLSVFYFKCTGYSRPQLFENSWGLKLHF